MKLPALLLLLLIFPFCFPTPLPAQEKGVTPTPHSALATPHSTRAVVIGISDYQDPAIPDLRFADRDAEAFYRWLHDPEACALPDSNIQLLTNKKATTAQMMMAMDWLIEVSKSGDQAFLYFSGHGDVERITEFQRGYLLSYNSPPAVYGAGAFPLYYLQDIITTLSNKGVQVFVITDACRAGKLAGSSVNGTQATAAQLSQQFAKEIKILSCQPDEFSLEGEQWGGGRGCFSYHLEDALYGFADDNHDAVVDLRELRRYLEDHVSKEAAPQNQMPMVSGPAQTNLARIQEVALTARKAAKGKGILPFLAIENKGLESSLLEKTDSSIRYLYAQFLTAIDSGHLLAPLGQCANDYYNILMEKPEMVALQGSMKRKLAAALMDEGQNILNKILQTDPQVLDNIWANRVHYDHLPAYFERAAEILGEKHYVWRDLKAKEFYFRAMTIRAENYPDSSADWRTVEKRRLLEKSLEWDSTSAVVYYELGTTYPWFALQKIEHYKKALNISPEWALIHLVLGGNLYINDPLSAINHFKKTIEIDSNFLSSYSWLPSVFDFTGQMDSAVYWRKLYVHKFFQKMEEDANTIKAYEYNDMGNVLWMLRDYEQAKAFLLKGENMSGGKLERLYRNLIAVYTDLLDFESAIQASKTLLKLSNTPDWGGSPGDIYFYFLNDIPNAIISWEKAGDYAGVSQIQAWYTMDNFNKTYYLAKKNVNNWPDEYDWTMNFYLAEAASKMGMVDTARHYYNQIIEKVKDEFIKKKLDDYKRNNNSSPGYATIALAFDRLGEKEEFQRLLDTVTARLAGDPWLHFHLATIFAQTNQDTAAIESLQKAIELGWQPNPLLWLDGTLCDPLLNPIRESEGYKALVREHFPKYYDIATRIPGR